jgi:anti-sigma factor (TIGR02949 family)
MTPLECRQVFAMLSEYLDGELPSDICERMSRHIEECPPCVEFVRTLQRTVDLCRGLKSTEPVRIPDSVREELLRAYREGLLQDGQRS